MNSQLQKALSELKAAGAIGLPNSSSVDSAKDGTTWEGKKSNSDPWSLTKK